MVETLILYEKRLDKYENTNNFNFGIIKGQDKLILKL